MLPTNGKGDSNKPYYDNSYTPLLTMSTNNLNDLTLCPYMFNTSSGYGSNSLELWNKNNTAKDVNNNTVHKTIYDPSPTGYVLPKPAAFTGFSTSNTSGWSTGWNFYGQLNKTGSTVFFPAFGWRYTTTFSVVSVIGDYWSAAPSTSARGLNFDSNNVNPLFEWSRDYGFSVYPVLE
jgi:hypothetical protein